MKNLPQPLSTYVTRFIDQYNVLNISSLDENAMSELIINNKSQLNNLLMSGLGASTLILRLGAVINLSKKLDKGNDDEDAVLMKQIIEYVWSFNDINFNSILKISNEIVNSLNNLPICYIESNNKLIKLIPYKLFKCPFRKNNNIFVLCTIDKNNRNILLNNNYSESTFIEFTQQFYLVDIMTNRPLGFPPIDQGEPPNNDYYCGIGVLSSFGRKYMEEFTLNCLYSDVKIDTINSLSTPGHWQYKLHKFDCINSLDNLIASKFILEKICEKYNLIAPYNNLNNNNLKKSKLIIKFSRENMISNKIY